MCCKCTVTRDSFKSAVHKNPELSKIDKFNYLNSLLEGRALRAVQGLTVSEDNYKAAVEISQRFGKPQQIISSLGVNSKQYGSLLIPVIMAKLPQEVRVQIASETTKEI